MAIQRGKPILKDISSDEELLNLGTPLTKIEEFQIFHQPFPKVHLLLYTLERWFHNTTFISHNF